MKALISVEYWLSEERSKKSVSVLYFYGGTKAGVKTVLESMETLPCWDEKFVAFLAQLNQGLYTIRCSR